MQKKEKNSIREISKAVNVSIGTVSRVLNNKPDVNPETRERILGYLQKINYQPRMLAFKPRLIGVVDTFKRHKLGSYYLSNIIEAVDEGIYSFGCNTVIIHSDLIENEFNEFGQVRIFNRLDGVLWLEPKFNEKYHRIVRKHNLPCVVINNCEPDIDVDLVESDNFSAAEQAVEYLVNHDHKAVGFLGGWLNLTNHKDRFAGYKKAMAAAGLSIHRDWIIDDITLWNEEGGSEGMHRLLSRKNLPTAVILCSDFLAIGVYKAAKERGFNIPDDISVISFDDFPVAAYLDPPLTTHRQPLREMGRMAAERLGQIIRDKGTAAPEKKYLRCPLIVRKSVKS